jgi:hypothetical protein
VTVQIRRAQARRCAQAQRAKQRAKWPAVAATEYMVQSPYPVQCTAVKVVTVDQLQDALRKDVLHIVVAAHLDLTPLAASWRTLWSPVGTQTVRVCAHCYLARCTDVADEVHSTTTSSCSELSPARCLISDEDEDSVNRHWRGIV